MGIFKGPDAVRSVLCAEFALNEQNKREGCLPVSELVKTLHFQLFSKQACGNGVLLWSV